MNEKFKTIELILDKLLVDLRVRNKTDHTKYYKNINAI